MQKYVEQPQLLGGVKFDIRQFVLVTSVDPLVVWFYDACYMRVASHSYSLSPQGIQDRYAQLCNFSVQKHATGFEGRADSDSQDGGSGAVGDQTERSRYDGNVCSHRQFVKTLQDRHGEEGGTKLWHDTIQPAMRHLCVQTLKAASQSSLVARPQCFELYGFDIVLDHKYRPWLLEVNLSPALNHRTPMLCQLYHHMVWAATPMATSMSSFCVDVV